MNPYEAIKNVLSKDGYDKLKQDDINKKKAAKNEEDFTRAKNYKIEISNKWRRFWDLYQGKHWSNNMPSYKSRTQENLIFSLIESQIPLMCDQQPEILALPKTKDDVALAEEISGVFSHIWETDYMQEKLVKVIRDQLTLGTGIIKVTYNPDKLRGAGDIENYIVDPFDFFPSPGSISSDDMEWCIHRTKMPLRVIRKLYPETGQSVVSDSDYLNDQDNRQVPGQNSPNSGTHATVIEKWFYDDKTGKTKVCVSSNGVFLEEKETPFEKEGFPFVFFFDHQVTSSFWGIGETEILAPLQEELNKTHQLIMDNMIATNNSVWIVDKTAGVKANKITNEPGLIIEKNPGGEIRREAPPTIPHYFQAQLDIIKTAMEEVTGIHEISKGIAAGSVTAASAISILTENSQTRVRGKLRNAEFALKRLGEWWVALIRQFYDSSRVIRIIGKNGMDFPTFDGRNLRQPSQESYDENGQLMTDPHGNPLFEDLIEFDINITSGSSMLLNKSAKFNQALTMFQNHVLDPETLLEISEIGDVEQIKSRLIQYGMVKDPNTPTIDPAELLQGLGLRFNLSSQDPTLVYEALQKFMDQYQQISGQTPQPQLPPEIKKQMDAGMLPPQGLPTDPTQMPQQ